MTPNLKGWKHLARRRRGLPLIGAFTDGAPLPPAAAVDPAHVPAPVDQSTLSSCVANALCECAESVKLRSGASFEQLARLKLYYDTRVRVAQERPDDDGGCLISDGVLALEHYGVCREAIWPYDTSKYAVAPSPEADAEGLQRKTLLAYHCPTLTELKASIAQGFPVAFGFVVYESLMSQRVADTGEIPMPAKDEKVLGGHAVTAVAYDDGTRRVRLLNSWGESWGDSGFATISYDYFDPLIGGGAALADDAWTIRVVSW